MSNYTIILYDEIKNVEEKFVSCPSLDKFDSNMLGRCILRNKDYQAAVLNYMFPVVFTPWGWRGEGKYKYKSIEDQNLTFSLLQAYFGKHCNFQL